MNGGLSAKITNRTVWLWVLRMRPPWNGLFPQKMSCLAKVVYLSLLLLSSFLLLRITTPVLDHQEPCLTATQPTIGTPYTCPSPVATHAMVNPSCPAACSLRLPTWLSSGTSAGSCEGELLVTSAQLSTSSLKIPQKWWEATSFKSLLMKLPSRVIHEANI